MRLSLRYRLLLPLALLLAGDLLATAWAASAAASAADRRLAGQLWAVADTLSGSRAYPLTDYVLAQMKGLSGAEFVLIRPDGAVVSTLPDPAARPPADLPPAVPSGGDHALGPPVTVGGTDYRCLRLPLRPPHPNAGADLYVFYPEGLRRSAVWDAVRPPLLLGLVGGLLAGGLGFWLGGGLVRRVRDLDRRTRLIAGGDFRPLPVPAPDDELADLGRSVNDMARRLAEYRDALAAAERLRVLGQFSGGLAHQLRNAVAGARLAVEVYLAENPGADPEPLRVALRQLARIEGTVRQFLDLGKPPAVARGPVDLVAVIGQAVNLLGPQCRHAGTTLSWEPPAGPVMTSGDAGSLGHLFGNVIGNAVEAAGPGGEVIVRGPTVREGGSVVEVIDTGPGPPADIAEKLFDPFVTGKEEGIGLGLAVARQVAEAHAGRLTWDRRDGKTVFRVELPG